MKSYSNLCLISLRLQALTGMATTPPSKIGTAIVKNYFLLEINRYLTIFLQASQSRFNRSFFPTTQFLRTFNKKIFVVILQEADIPFVQKSPLKGVILSFLLINPTRYSLKSMLQRHQVNVICHFFTTCNILQNVNVSARCSGSPL